MHSLNDWLLPVALAYIILGSALKGKAALMGQFIFCWGAAAVSAVSAWQLQHRWSEIEARMQTGNTYNAIILRRHEEMFLMFVGIIVLLLAPVIAYWFEQRKKRRATLSAETV